MYLDSAHNSNSYVLLSHNYLIILQFREKRIEQEKELIQKQNTWLSEELKTKTDELVKLRKEKVF